MCYAWNIDDKVLCTSICERGAVFYLCELWRRERQRRNLCVDYVKLLTIRLRIFTCMDVFNGVFVCVRACMHVCVYACVRMIALVTQAISHSHCSKLWVGEGHCGADRGDREERGDGGWAAEKETEGDDNEKLKAARKWDVGLHSRAAAFRCKKVRISPGAWALSTPLRWELLVSARRTEAFELKVTGATQITTSGWGKKSSFMLRCKRQKHCNYRL